MNWASPDWTSSMSYYLEEKKEFLFDLFIHNILKRKEDGLGKVWWPKNWKNVIEAAAVIELTGLIIDLKAQIFVEDWEKESIKSADWDVCLKIFN